MRAFKFITRTEQGLLVLDTAQLVRLALDERFARDSLEHAHTKIDAVLQLFLQLALGYPGKCLCEFVEALGWTQLIVAVEKEDGTQEAYHYADTATALCELYEGDEADAFIRGLLLETEHGTSDMGTRRPGATGSGLPQQSETSLVERDELVGGAARDGDGQSGTVPADNRDTSKQNPQGD